MNDYNIIIMRGDDVIMDKQITADKVIDLLREQEKEKIVVTGTPIVVVPVVKPKEKKEKPVAKPAYVSKRKKGVKYCKSCGKPGHMSKTCPTVSKDPEVEEAESTPEQAMDEMRGTGFKVITPEQLNTVKSMLEAGSSYEDTAEKSGLAVERVEKMAVQLGY